MKPRPYVGVSGFMSASEVTAALDAFPVCARLLMIGVLVSAKTLIGQPNKYPRRYPDIATIDEIFPDDPRALNLVHYSSEEEPDCATVETVFLAGGTFCHGAQFNGAWPAPDVLEYARWACEERPPRVVLQVRDWLDAPSLSALPGKLEPYRGVATDILLDASGGRGIPLDPTWAAVAVETLRRSNLDMGIGIAGRLSAESLGGVAHLIRDGVSADTESPVRDDADGGGNMDQAKVKAYLAAAGKAIGGSNA